MSPKMFAARTKSISDIRHNITSSPKARFWLRLFGLAVLVGGAVWSVTVLDLSLSDVSVGYLLLNLLLLAPLNLLLAAVSLRINANALAKDISLPSAFQTVSVANVAELLPLPGGALVRGAALIKAGVSPKESAAIVTETAILMLSMTVTFSAFALVLFGQAVGWIAVFGGGVALAAIVAWMIHRYTLRSVSFMIGIRIGIILLSVLRLSVAFATIGALIGLDEAAIYSAATSLGSTVAIVPAGLGVNEAIAASLAAMIARSPAAAFLAVTVNRATGLAAGALASVLIAGFQRQKP